MNATLTQYVREALARGTSREQVRADLAAARWRPEEIEAALGEWADGASGIPVPRRRVSISAREAFFHLVLFATLYIFTIDIGVLLFVLIDERFRDVAAMPLAGALDTLRWSTAGSLTALPIFVWMHHRLEREMAREPEKRTSGVRRWLTYLTLFAAALALIGNFSTLVSTLLAGSVTVRFALKALVVFAIAGAVFGHFLRGLRRDETDDGARLRADWPGRVALALAVLAILGGLFAAGGPQAARRRQLDWRRVEDLRSIARQVDAFHAARHELPRSLDRLVQAGFDVPERRDPEKGRYYGYAVLDTITFTLTAEFTTADTLGPGGEPVPASWRHGRGPQTFTRQVPLTGEGWIPARR